MKAGNHIPVLAREVIASFSPLPPGAAILDATVGAGGHSDRLLELCDRCTLVGIDADSEMVQRATERLETYGGRVQILTMWFDEFLTTDDRQYDRILFDLGVSMLHFSNPQVGMSFRHDGPLDMRLKRTDPTAKTAADLVNSLPENELADLIYHYGEERFSRRIASAICVYRRKAPVATTKDLAEIVWNAVPPAVRHGRLHPATRTFQALRIAVNDELDRLKRALPAAMSRLKPGGRIGVISFHSLEDRIVKHQFRNVAKGVVVPSKDGRLEPMVDTEASSFRLCTKKPIVPSADEVASNSPSRSAKLRVLERLHLGGAA